MSVSEISSSGEVTSSFVNISNVFTSYTEIPSKGFNQLYKAKRYGKWFVLKGLKTEHRNEPLYRELLTKEFELGILMEHPNIAHTIGIEEDPVAGPCVVMEYVDGVTLREFLVQKPSRKIRMKIVKELLSAMSYYHNLQIIHRDLKPANILITHNGQNVKIIDFGLADSDYHSVLKQPAGSNKYAAPEQLDDKVTIDCRADIYAFGIILRQIFPNGYGSVIRKCTRPDRELRYSNAEEVLRRLQARQRIAIFTFVSIVALLAASGLWWLLQQQHSYMQNPETVQYTEPAPPETVHDTVILTQQHTEIVESQVIFNKQAQKMIEDGLDEKMKPWFQWWDSIKPTYTAFANTFKFNEEDVAKYSELARLFNEKSRLYMYTETALLPFRDSLIASTIATYPQCEEVKWQLEDFFYKKWGDKWMIVHNDYFKITDRIDETCKKR